MDVLDRLYSPEENSMDGCGMQTELNSFINVDFYNKQLENIISYQHDFEQYPDYPSDYGGCLNYRVILFLHKYKFIIIISHSGK